MYFYTNILICSAEINIFSSYPLNQPRHKCFSRQRGKYPFNNIVYVHSLRAKLDFEGNMYEVGSSIFT